MNQLGETKTYWNLPDGERLFHRQRPDRLWPTGYDKGRVGVSNRLRAGNSIYRLMRDIHVKH